MKRLFSLCWLLALSGCDGDDYQPRPVELPPGPPLPECPDADYAPCDVRERACQTRLAELAACLRRSEPLRDLRVDVLSEASYGELLQQENRDTPEPAIPHFHRALSRFGLAPFDGVPLQQQIDDTVTFVAGQYREDEKRVLIVDHGKPADSGATNAVLIHEFIHALQDAAHDLKAWSDDAPRTFDSSLALRTVVEGEAEFYGQRAAVPLLGLDIEQVDFESALQARLDRRLIDAFDGKLLLTQSQRTISYGMGALRAFHAWQHGGPSGIEPLWHEPPLTMQRVMAELFARNAPQAAGVAMAAPVVSQELQPYADNVLGAWGLCLVLTQHAGNGAKAADFVDQALSWRGDHFWVYTNDARSTYALWQLELESPEAAQALDELFAALHVAHGSAGSRVFASYDMNERGPMPELTAWGKRWLDSGGD